MKIKRWLGHLANLVPCGYCGTARMIADDNGPTVIVCDCDDSGIQADSRTIAVAAWNRLQRGDIKLNEWFGVE